MEKKKKVKSYKGKFRPERPEKYKGNFRNIIYRSMWERRFMVYCDRNENILQWGSEELAIPYQSPLDGKLHRYYPDFYLKVKQHDHTVKEFIVEIKPQNQVKPPKKKPKRRTKEEILIARHNKKQAALKKAKQTKGKE